MSCFLLQKTQPEKEMPEMNSIFTSTTSVGLAPTLVPALRDPQSKIKLVVFLEFQKKARKEYLAKV